ncbi:beta-1,4-N-acetylgalactosaminyltransferase bre-4-like isoform X2 [Tubulanus polymorphus]|uniref:beta-1,4-N-acetylgalactosaminyltransferase bre-4-like isoform X2 n=1 Tax=Tubulanus polymorphus TaxID=672921 RepID=UPI003DA3630B
MVGLSCCMNCFYERRLRFVIIVVLTLILLQYGVNLFIFKTRSPFTSLSSHLNINRFWNQQTSRGRNDASLRNFNGSIGYSTKMVTQDLTRNRASIHSPAENTTGISQCPMLPPNLVGRIRVKLDKPSFLDLENKHQELQPGGHWKPTACISRHRVAIIIPFRDRHEHLRMFLSHMHPFLQKQQLDYQIFVIEEMPGIKFNRAMLMNIGYVEANKVYDFQCYVFHDVDLLPEDDRNIYSCPEQPRHLSVAIDKFNYRLPYTDIFGGACTLSKVHFSKINGFSNKYWGWGGEDDDLAYRWSLLQRAFTRFSTDGLSSLKYKVVATEYKKLYTLIKVEINEKDV